MRSARRDQSHSVMANTAKPAALRPPTRPRTSGQLPIDQASRQPPEELALLDQDAVHPPACGPRREEELPRAARSWIGERPHGWRDDSDDLAGGDPPA